MAAPDDIARVVNGIPRFTLGPSLLVPGTVVAVNDRLVLVDVDGGGRARAKAITSFTPTVGKRVMVLRDPNTNAHFVVGFVRPVTVEGGGGGVLPHSHDYAATVHTHPYADPAHTHDGVYSDPAHTHDAAYAPLAHTHTATAISGAFTDLAAGGGGGGGLAAPYDTATVLLTAELTGSPTVWPNRGTAGGSATISGSPTIANGGISPQAAGDYAELALAGLDLATAGGLTLAVRYLHQQTTADQVLAALVDISNASRVEIIHQTRSTNTLVRPRAQFEFVASSALEQKNLNNIAPTDAQQVLVARFYPGAGSGWDVKLYDSTQAALNLDVNNGDPAAAVDVFDVLRVGRDAGGSAAATLNNITGIALWSGDPGDAAMAALSPADAAWSYTGGGGGGSVVANALERRGDVVQCLLALDGLTFTAGMALATIPAAYRPVSRLTLVNGTDETGAILNVVRVDPDGSVVWLGQTAATSRVRLSGTWLAAS